MGIRAKFSEGHLLGRIARDGIEGAEAQAAHATQVKKLRGVQRIGYRFGERGAFFPLKAGLKAGGLAALGIAAVTAGGFLLRSMRNPDHGRPERDDRLNDMAHELPPVLMPQMMPMQGGPADGRAEGEWQNRVIAARNGMAPQVGVANPAMTAVPAEQVAELAAEPVPQR